MRTLTVKEVLRSCGGQLLCGDERANIESVTIDSREAKEGSLFVPFVGEKSDAHQFIPDVMQKGAAAALTEKGFFDLKREELRDGFALISVENSLQALQKLAAFRRKTIPVPMIGVTGSVGKTTTREMIAKALSAEKSVYRTPKNHNGQIGVPLTILEMEDHFDLAVIEMGISCPGEMEKISRLVCPDAAVLTNIGFSHIEQLKTQENIRAEKLHIQDGMPEGAAVFLNGDDPLLWRCAVRKGLRPIYYGTTKNCDAYAKDIRLKDGCAVFQAMIQGEEIPVSLQVKGMHQVLNAMAALSIAAHYEVNLLKAVEKLSAFKGYRHRQELVSLGGITILDDSYNASPASMCAALDVLGEMKHARRRIAVLADMKELGREAETCHEAVGRYLATENKADALFTFGELASFIAKAAKKADASLKTEHFETRDELTAALKCCLQDGDAVLLKGSNSMNLSNVSEDLIAWKNGETKK